MTRVQTAFPCYSNPLFRGELQLTAALEVANQRVAELEEMLKSRQAADQVCVLRLVHVHKARIAG